MMFSNEFDQDFIETVFIYLFVLYGFELCGVKEDEQLIILLL